MNSRIVMEATWIGFLSGMVMALFLGMMQNVTGHQVYTLLLNVDYIPIMKEYHFPESIEVLFHLIVSVILCIILAIIYSKSERIPKKRIIYFSLIVNVVIGLLLYPTTSFSERTPSITSISAWFWWTAAHVIFGVLVGILLRSRIK
ncbi:hypothetical protein [Sporosarcina sp. FSL W7-1283]|uniref:hypothetical protein n=1 Tax=Sporosarcina sp. FSL W7-1283 TaxID=2921560 RepID=UPI0030FABEF8